MKARRLCCAIVATILTAAFAFGTDDEKDSDTDREEGRMFRIWAGYSSYSMKDFNSAQDKSRNATIDNGLALGVEVSLFDCDFSVPGRSFLLPGITSLSIPVGIEYLSANAKTTHIGAGGSATVEWNLPVLGVYCNPELCLEGAPWLHLRPLTIGYYSIGKVLDASLTVTDQPGQLAISGATLGVATHLGVKHKVGNREFSVEGSYRWLKFTDLEQTPEGGYGCPPGQLQYDLDYSGWCLMVAMGWGF